MHASGFNVYIRDFPEPGVTLVYNTLTGAFAEVEGEGEALAAAASADPSLADEDAGFLVSDRAEDERRLRAWYERLRSGTETLTAIVSTTFACNFECSYCCQADVLDGRTMSEATAVATGRWLGRRAREIGAHVLELAFIGGEPLLQPRRIERIVEAARAEAPAAALRFTIITNGVLMTRELVERWVPLGLVAAKVTLDGDGSTHAKTRISKKGEDTFQTIFDNVVAASELIAIDVNGNYQMDTVVGFPGLVDELRAAGLPSSTTVRFSPAVTALGAPEGSASGACTLSGSNPELMIALRDSVVAGGFDPGDTLVIGPCGFHRHHTYSIDPEGQIYKCPGFLGKTEWAIGHVESGLGPRYRQFIDFQPLDACGGCSQRPNCAGGCIAAEWIKRGEAAGIGCEHEFFDRCGDELVKRKYAATLSEADGIDPFSLVPRRELAIAGGERERGASGIRSKSLRVLA